MGSFPTLFSEASFVSLPLPNSSCAFIVGLGDSLFNEWGMLCFS